MLERGGSGSGVGLELEMRLIERGGFGVSVRRQSGSAKRLPAWHGLAFEFFEFS
jgi:hypothetical protein